MMNIVAVTIYQIDQSRIDYEKEMFCVKYRSERSVQNISKYIDFNKIPF